MLTPQQNFNASPDISVHVRCPDCFKLYAVKASDIHEARPQFQCVDCSAQFWMPYPECLESAAGLIGFPLENAREPRTANTFQAKPFSCPKCGSGYSGGQTECEKCGVLFAKFLSKTPGTRSDFSASKELKALWDAAILEYEKEDRHRAFIRYGLTDGNVEYVSRKYSDVLDSNPSDEMALKMQKELAAITVAKAESVRRPLSKGWQDWSIPKLRFSPVLYVMGGALVVGGLVMPGMRNLIGFGCSILFLTLMVKFYFQTAKKV
ncbi:MAG: hypothetical protein AABZ31_06820 [Bdellovibrionota bacterium]